MLKAKVAKAMKAQARKATSRSPIDAAAVAVARAEQISRVWGLIGENKGLTVGSSVAESSIRPTISPVQLKAAGKETALPAAPERQRQRGGPGGREVRASDMHYDFHTLDGVPQLSEREGHPMLLGTRSYNKGRFSDLLRQQQSKPFINLLMVGRDYGIHITRLCEEELGRVEAEPRASAFEEGHHSVEIQCFKQVAHLDAKISYLKNRVFAAENAVNSAKRECDGMEARMKKAKGKKRAYKTENTRLKAEALMEARAEVKKEVSKSETRIESAEASATLADACAKLAEEHEGQLVLCVEALTTESKAPRKAMDDEQLHQE